ncbi:hypothetical protein H9635_04600 [Solibacillus sp. A46]|uniref:Uncharacterized protein n=1 Tax=Solibacillus faecavium TaxID=2762221 RepID=A0ABR8XVN5_9BACL|nr:hypothetical protein [Solibacillus faecavium]MBD8036010.1 hypothetical protein [Solibacillus faecavium]
MSYWQKQSKETNEQMNPLADSGDNFRPISEIYLKIHQYELFYRDHRMQSKEAVTFFALNDAINKYALIDYLHQQNITLSEEKRQLQRELLEEQLTKDLQDHLLKPYLETMFQALNISNQDYIEQYLLINTEHDLLKEDMFSSNKGLVQDETGLFSYPSSDQQTLYQEKMKISFDYMEYLAESEFIHIKPDRPTFDLPFAIDSTFFNFTKNLAGETIFASKEFSESDLTMEQRDFLYVIKKQYNLHELARYNFILYKNALQQEAAPGSENQAIANELMEIFKIAERTIDWEIGEVTKYEFNEIPMFDVNQLRKHKDITLQLYEHEYYYREEEIPKKFYAFRIANEEIVAMYALFNYLKQDFGIELDETIRSSTRAKIEKSLNEQLQNPYYKKYMDNLLQTFEIPLSSYINDYLLVKEEYELLLQLIKDRNIGIDHDGRYNKGWIEARYRTAANLLWEDQFKKMWDMQLDEVVKPLEPQPELSFTLSEYAPPIGLNNEGQYIFVNIYALHSWLTDEQQTLFDLLVKTYDLPVLSRYSITEYKDKLELLKADESEKKQLLEILEIFERSIRE